MEIDAALDFVRTNDRAVLATIKRDGTTQLSPVTVGVDGDGKVVISSRETAFKVRNLRRNPQAELCVMRDEFF
ncbi:MAG: pyridoxamine 5'-phosphate oxidase family protein, partial [Frankia sp.]